jgi:DNA-binding transcriptional MerR regulator
MPKGSNTELLSLTMMTKFTGLSKKALRYYNDKGVCRPHRINESSGYWRYLPEQTNYLLLIKKLVDTGVPLKTVSISDDGDLTIDSLFDSALEVTSEYIRKQRRALKSIVHCKIALQDSAALGKQEGYYLRYVPERWVALLPIAWPEEISATSLDFIEHLMYLNYAIDIYGWAGTEMSGALHSLSLDTRQGLMYAFVELSSPPMPEITGSWIVDGGCYHSAVLADTKTYCTGKEQGLCATCARNGVASEKTLWTGDDPVKAELLSSFTVMMDDLKAPYRTGLWSEFTKKRIAEREGYEFVDEGGEGHKRERASPHPNPAMTPMLMPHVIHLPHGITTCIMPAGIYLCKQHTRHDAEGTRRALLDIAEKLPRLSLSPEDEKRRHERFIDSILTSPSEIPREPFTGPYPEPFAMPRIVADPEMLGWSQLLKDTDPTESLADIALRFDTGLVAETDFCLIDSRMLLPVQSLEPHFEMQLLVDTDRERSA